VSAVSPDAGVLPSRPLVDFIQADRNKLNMQPSSVHELDVEWEKWGVVDPYFGVLTAPSFRRENLTDQARDAFFRTGELHVKHVLSAASRSVGRPFNPESVLDFGCGVGRLVVPFARAAQRAVGVDVAQSMLSEAARNCEQFGLKNVELRQVDDTLRSIDERFDLVHSFIVFQHIEPTRGLAILRRLLSKVKPGGCAVIHVTYGRNYGLHDYGTPTVAIPPVEPKTLRRIASEATSRLRSGLRRPNLKPATLPEASGADPKMPMFTYDLGKVIYVMHESGFIQVDTELVNHAGELGALMCAGLEVSNLATPASREEELKCA